MLFETLAPLVLAGALAASSVPLSAPLNLSACELPGLAEKVRCGSLSVFEDRAAAKGRKINLKIVVLPAKKPASTADPIFVLAGGPGEAATEEAAGTASEFVGLRESHDFVLVDQRGTGGSHPLNCDLFGNGRDLQRLLGDFLPIEEVRRCRAALEKGADLRLYTTSIAMDDLDDVRAALGYEKINLFGGSYGTRAALVYMRQHPSRVRAAVLEGVSPTTDHVPLAFPKYAQDALQGVVGECLADSACHDAFPNLARDAVGAFAQVSKGPVWADVLHPSTGEPARVKLSGDIVGEAVRYLTYQAGTAGLVPVVLHEAAGGNFDPLAEFAIFARKRIVGSGSMGMYLSVTCAEDLPFVQTSEGERLAAGTYLGDYRLKQQSAACQAWPRGAVPRDFTEPVRSQAPALLIVGQWDPVTPPALASAAVRTLSAGKVVVVPHGAHSQEGLEGIGCVDRLMTTFLETGNSKGLDFDCLEKVRRAAFALVSPIRKPIPMAEADLTRFSGRYIGEGVPLEAQVERVGGKLRVRLAGEGEFVLVPVASDTFGVVGAPGVFVTFDVKDGRVARLRVRKPGAEDLVLASRP